MEASNQILLIVSLLAVLVIALTINFYIYRRQLAAEKRRIKLKKLQKILPELLECLSTLKATDCSAEVLTCLEKHAAELFEQLGKLAPNPELVQNLQSQRTLNSEPTIEPTSVEGLKQIQKAVNKSTTVLQQLHSNEQLNEINLERFKTELAHVQIGCEIDALYAQAEALISEGKNAVAKTSIRQGMSKLQKISSKDPRRDSKRGLLIKKMDSLAPPPSPQKEDNQSASTG